MDDLELIKQKINIVDLIQEYIPLKKAGVNYKANCPFHNEKTPSFMVSPERQIFHCFGCDVGGDLFKFLMLKEGLEFKEALELSAKKAGVVLKKSSTKRDSRDKLYEANLKAEEFFHYILTKHLFGKSALEYLQKRGLKIETIDQFGIGYSPHSWESLTKFMLKRAFTSQDLINAGLAVQSKIGCYDRFRGRITFPLIDARGQVVGFSGRVLDGSEPKYINTPQTTIFSKSDYLFGINLAKSEIKSKNEAIVAEGEMDVILSYQAGIKNIVAVKGSALTEGQLSLLKKYTENLKLCFDMDLAGDSASRRGIEIADSLGFNIKVIQLGGKDPAEVINNNPKDWLEAIDKAVPIYDYYLSSVILRFNPKESAGLRSIAGELIPIWAKISDDLVREHYTQKLATLLQTEEKILRADIQKARLGSVKNYSQAFKQPAHDDQLMESRTRRELLEEYLMALLLHIPKDHLFVPSFVETLLISENLRQIYVLLVLYLDSISFKGRSFDINEFSKTVSAELLVEVDKLYLIDLDEKLADKLNWQKEVDGVISELKKALIKASLEKLGFEIKSAEQFGKMEVMESLNRRFRDLSVKLKNL